MALPTMNPQAAKVFKQPVMGDTRPTPKPKPQPQLKPSPKSTGSRPKPSPKSTGKPNPKIFERPVPGQSLTAEPKSRPYERPPEINDPEEALRYHLTRLNDVESLDTVMLLLQKGVDVKSLTEGIMRGAVSEGIHNIDISLTIAPTVHEFIETVADEVGVSYKTGFEKGEQEEDDKEMALVKSMLAKSKGKPKAAPREEPKQQMEMDLGEPEAAPKGLMARV